MSDSAVAAEHLKVIRRMMERATIYRAISGPVAVIGGLLALAVGFYFMSWGTGDGPVDGMRWFWIWVGALVAVDLCNTILLWRKSARAGEDFLSAGLKHALCAVAPPLVVGGMISFEWARADQLENCVLTWVLCYGVALLAMSHFAPRSLRRLGVAFLVSGGVIFFVWGQFSAASGGGPSLGGRVGTASWMMIGTFGLLHLAYGLIVMLGAGREEVPT